MTDRVTDDAGASRSKVLDDPSMDVDPIDEHEAREAARRMASSAINKGATSVAHDGELDPCGLDEALDALFGEVPVAEKRPFEGKAARWLKPKRVQGLPKDGY